MPITARSHKSSTGAASETDQYGISDSRSRQEDGTLESLMARASMSTAEPVLDQTLHARQAIKPSLLFRDQRLEVIYQADYFTKYVRAMRRSIIIGIFLWALFVINDIIKNRQGKRRNIAATISLRFGVIALALAVLAATFSHKIPRLAITWSIGLVITLFGAAQVGSGVIEEDTIDPTYSVAIVLISSTSSAFFRLPFFPSIACNIAMFIIYVVLTGTTNSYDTSTDFGTTCLWLIIGVMIFSLLAYDREWYIRSSYLAQRRLEYEEHKSQKVLLKMLPLSVITQLRAGAEFMHERHSNISVLFSHICEFDHMCLLDDTPVALRSGQTIPAADVRPGMDLTGEDGRVARVKDVQRLPNTRRLFEIVTAGGGAYTVTHNHRLTLRWNRGPSLRICQTPLQQTPRLVLQWHDRAGARHTKQWCVDPSLLHNTADDELLAMQQQDDDDCDEEPASLPPSSVSPVTMYDTREDALHAALTDLDEKTSSGEWTLVDRPRWQSDRSTYEINTRDASGVDVSRTYAVRCDASTLLPHVSGTGAELRAMSHAYLEKHAGSDVRRAGDLFEVTPVELLRHWQRWQMEAPKNGREGCASTVGRTQMASGRRVPMPRRIPLPPPSAHPTQPSHIDAFPTAAAAAPGVTHSSSLVNFTLLARADGEYTPLYQDDAASIAYQLHSPLVAREGYQHLHSDGEHAYTFLTLDRVHEHLGINPAAAGVAISELHPIAGISDQRPPTPTMLPAEYDAVCENNCRAIIALGVTRIVAFGRDSRQRWMRLKETLSDADTQPMLSTQGGIQTLQLTVRSQVVTIFFSPHPAAWHRANDIMAAVGLAHGRGVKWVDELRKSSLPSVEVDPILAVRPLSTIADVINIEVFPDDRGQQRYALGDGGVLTHNSSIFSPNEVIGLLNHIFSRFDEVTDEFGVYKVETIGDVYLVSAGLPEAREDHANALAHVAVSMMESLPEFQSVDRMPVQLKIGIHSGPVIAGVVGMKYPRFRLMGDTVNTASRMSSTCHAGDIQLSPNCFHQLKPGEFVVHYRGEIEVKGKGRMKTYLVKSRSAAASMEVQRRTNKRSNNSQGLTPRAPMNDAHPLVSSAVIPNLPGTPQTTTTTQFHPPPPVAVTDSQLRMTDAIDVELTALTPAEEARLAELARKSPVTIHLPHHQSRAFKESPRSSVAAVSSATDVQLETINVVPAFALAADTHLASASSSFTNATATPPLAAPKADRVSPIAPMLVFPHSHRSASVPLPEMLSTGPQLLRAASVDAEPTPGMEVQPRGGLVPNEVIRLTGITSPRERLAKRASMLSVKSGLVESTAKDVLRITAKNVQVEVLFDTIEWDTLIDAKNPLSLHFKYHPELEAQFQQDFFQRYLAPNRRGLLFFIVSMMLIGIYETLTNLPETSHETRVIGLTWILRVVALATGAAAYIFTYTHTHIYARYQQLILTCVWAVMGVLMISILIALETYTDVYGVTCVLLLLTMTSTFVGLQFLWVTSVTIFFLLWYVFGVLIIYGTFPLVVFFLIASNVLAITASRSGEYYLRWDYIRHLKLKNEEHRTRHFLDNMLPKSVIQEIKLDQSIAHEFLKASVLFSDIVSFTSLASRISPEDVVAILNVMFSTFDALTTKHNVYKVETIGDAYLACSGVVQRGPTQTEDLIKFSLDLQTSTQYMHTPDGQPIIIRIGIHTGSVVAGVVGRKMPRYHLFGETVTIAEEMEQNGIPGHVVISQSTMEECGGRFELAKLEPIALHAKPTKNILPGEAAAAAAAAHGQVQDQQQSHAEPTLVHRYQVLAYLGPIQPRQMRSVNQSRLDLFQSCRLPHQHTAACAPDAAQLAAASNRSPDSASHSQSGSLDDHERAPPPFVANILGRIQAKNFVDAQLRMQKQTPVAHVRVHEDLIEADEEDEDDDDD